MFKKTTISLGFFVILYVSSLFPMDVKLPEETTGYCTIVTEEELGILLSDAIQNNKYETVDFLVEKLSADVNHVDENGVSVLAQAFAAGSKDIVTLLLKNGAEVNVERDYKHMCTKDIKKEIVEVNESVKYINRHRKAKDFLGSISCDDVDKYKKEFVFLKAAQSGHFELVQSFIEYGVDPNCQGILAQVPGLEKGFFHFNTKSALHHACSSNNIEMANMLLEFGADVNVRDERGARPLDAAAYQGNAEVVSFLLGHGAEVTTKKYYSNCAILQATYGENPRKIIPLLYQSGPSLSIWHLRDAFLSCKPEALTAIFNVFGKKIKKKCIFELDDDETVFI